MIPAQKEHVPLFHAPREGSNPQGLIGCSCGWRIKKDRTIDPDTQLAYHVAFVTGRRSLLNRDDDEPGRAEIEAMEARPGYACDASASRTEPHYERLNQEYTDALIVQELRDQQVPSNELDDFERLAGHFVAPGVHRWGVTTQIGGVHSDPLVRLLAFRAWGRRDLDWTLPIRKRRPWEEPNMQNIPIPKARRSPASEMLRRAYEKSLHQAGCDDPGCDGQCFKS